MPASRSARAITFAPRSWPSRPTFAITTRVLPAIRRPASRATRPRPPGARRTSRPSSRPPSRPRRSAAAGYGPASPQPQRLVERVRVQRLRTAEHGRERLERRPHDVHLRLLRGQRDAGGLRVETEAQRALVASTEALPQLACPDPPRGPVLRDLLEE